MAPHPPSPEDSVAAAVETHLRALAEIERTAFLVEPLPGGYAVGFAKVFVQADTYDVALLRLAGALLDDETWCQIFLHRLRGDASLLPLRSRA